MTPMPSVDRYLSSTADNRLANYTTRPIHQFLTKKNILSAVTWRQHCYISCCGRWNSSAKFPLLCDFTTRKTSQKIWFFSKFMCTSWRQNHFIVYFM